jgi:hypothetical protein
MPEAYGGALRIRHAGNDERPATDAVRDLQGHRSEASLVNRQSHNPPPPNPPLLPAHATLIRLLARAAMRPKLPDPPKRG